MNFHHAVVSLGAVASVPACPVWFISSYRADGTPNIMCVSWAAVVSSKPLCVGVSVKTGALTHENISARRAFTAAVATVADIAAADTAGKQSGREFCELLGIGKYEAAGFSPVRSELVDAPYPSQAALVMECVVRHIIPLGSHSQFIGEVLDVKASEAVLENGIVAPRKLNPLLASASDRKYYHIGEELREI